MPGHGYMFTPDNNIPTNTNYSRQQNYPLTRDERLSTTVENATTYEDYVHYVCINSSDRNVTAYPHVNHYRIDFEDTFKNISSIEIVNGTVANQGSVQVNPYLVVRVDGLNHLNFSNKNINKGFALFYLKPTTGAHVQPELGVLQRNVRTFRTPLVSLSSLTISLTTPDGELFSFGEGAGDITVVNQNSFVFKIVCKEINRTSIGHRNLY